MNLDDYQRDAMGTCGDLQRGSLLYGALGLSGESGEFVDLVKKTHYHGHAVHSDRMKDELGDVLWYVAQLADALSLDLSEVARYNVEKLRARYPDGYSHTASRERDK